MPVFPRYISKFVNGTWVVFDRQQFRNVSTHGLQKHAVTNAANRQQGVRNER